MTDHPETSASSSPAEPAPLPGPPASIADGVEHPLDPRALTVQRITAWLVIAPILCALSIGLLLLLWLAPLLLWAQILLGLAGLGIASALVWSAHRWPEISHRHAAYTVAPEGIEVRRGVLWRLVIHVPRSRVQHTDVSQGPVERAYGLATLAIYTAGTDHAQVDLHGIDRATALAIRDHLVAGEGDDAV
ncbi:MAG TPA: hypothetical protein DD490_03105 [Acidobacteria bacterium]|nr:hypothetical protein [Acidobacteriota bacterium]